MEDASKLIASIKEQEIKPRPRWQFTVRNWVIWTGFIAFVILGALSFSVILFAIQQTEFDLIAHIGKSGIEMLLGLLPVIWLILLVGFLILAIFSIRYSWKGYKFSISKLTGINAGLSILLGTLFFITGGAQRLEHAFDTRLEAYQGIQERKVSMWTRPADGFHSGTIQSSTDDTLIILDFTGTQWTVEYTDAFVAPVLLLEQGERVKLIGKTNQNGVFIADEIRPWGGRRNLGNRRRNPDN